MAEQAPEIDLERCLHPYERSRYWLALLVVLPTALIFILATAGSGLLIVLPILFFAWFAVRLARAHLLGSAVEISETSFPEVFAQIEEIKRQLDYPKRVEAYAFQHGDVNTFLVKRFRTRMILLPHGLLKDTMKSENRAELTWFLARCIGHLKAKHLRLSWLNVLIESFEKLLLLNLFLYPWERATQYSGDRIGLAVCGDLPRAIRGFNRLILGNSLADQIDLGSLLDQKRRLKGSFFAWLAQCLSTHPHTAHRVASMIAWAREYNAQWYRDLLESEEDPNRIERLLDLASDVGTPQLPAASLNPAT